MDGINEDDGEENDDDSSYSSLSSGSFASSGCSTDTSRTIRSNSSSDDGSSDDDSSSLASSASPSMALLSLSDDHLQKVVCEWLKTNDEEEVYSSRVQDWTEKVPIGLNLCPWAKLSHKEGRIKYVTCHKNVQTPQQASSIIWTEIEKLLGEFNNNNNSNACPHHQQTLSLPPWSTSLVICPHVQAWRTDFKAFESFVKNFGSDSSTESYETTTVEKSAAHQRSSAIALVPFHPLFLRWRGLPETISQGSTIRCHRGLVGFSKSPDAHPATVVDLRPQGFGRRRIKVRFHDSKNDSKTNNGKAVQCIPVDWVVVDDEIENSEKGHQRPPLPDNAMHRSPYPVVHILRNKDLEALSIHDISRLKRRNAKRMASENIFG